MDTLRDKLASRQAATNGLAIIGFITLMSLGVWLAIYATRFVPQTVDRIGVAAVYLGSVFKQDETSTLSVVPTASTTIQFGEASSTSTTASASHTPETAARPVWTPSTPVDVANTAIPTTHTAPAYSGAPDLAVVIESVGTVAADGSSIIATTTIPAHTQIAMKFRVTNIGTNVSGPWTMNIAIPSGGASANQTFSQGSLLPSQPSEYIVRFDNITPGTGHTIVVRIDPNHTLAESNTGNNLATSSNITVLGS